MTAHGNAVGPWQRRGTMATPYDHGHAGKTSHGKSFREEVALSLAFLLCPKRARGGDWDWDGAGVGAHSRGRFAGLAKKRCDRYPAEQSEDKSRSKRVTRPHRIDDSRWNPGLFGGAIWGDQHGSFSAARHDDILEGKARTQSDQRCLGGTRKRDATCGRHFWEFIVAQLEYVGQRHGIAQEFRVVKGWAQVDIEHAQNPKGPRLLEDAADGFTGCVCTLAESPEIDGVHPSQRFAKGIAPENVVPSTAGLDFKGGLSCWVDRHGDNSGWRGWEDADQRGVDPEASQDVERLLATAVATNSAEELHVRTKESRVAGKIGRGAAKARAVWKQVPKDLAAGKNTWRGHVQRAWRASSTRTAPRMTRPRTTFWV